MDKDKLKKAIELAKQNPNTEFANELRKRIETGQIVIEKEQPSYLQRIGEQYSNIGERTTQSLQESGQGYLEKAKSGDILGATGELARSGLRAIGAVTEGAFAPITEAPVIKQALDFIGQKIGNSEIGQKLAKKVQENPETAQDIMDIVNTLTLGGGKAVEKPLATGVEKAITTGKQSLKTGIETLKTKEASKLVSQVDDLVGKITQGLEKDIPKAKKALSDIDTTGIKSYKDLSTTLNDKVSTLATKLDDILGQNTTKIGLEDAKNIIKVGEKSVEHNFIKDAITQLDDYFTKTNNIAEKETINQLKNKFINEGITIKDINDLARLHGEKMNSYNASGELASGLTKQAAENTRAGLKNTARDLFGDKIYKEIDSEISNVIRTRDLVDNVSKKVTQLQQKINERGFGEKVGRLAFQVADKFTGGGLKGFIQSFVPRGEGLKIMNALDLERSLKNNLKLLDKAMNSKTESNTIKALEGILNYIENPKVGLGIEDVSKNQASEPFLKSQPTTNIVNKTPKNVISKTIPQTKITTTNLSPEVKDNIVAIIDDYRLGKGKDLTLQQDASRIAEDLGIKMPKKYGDLVNKLEDLLAKSDQAELSFLKGKGEIPETNLINEAKKYKSAEEFVFNTKNLFRGTNDEGVNLLNAGNIPKEGLSMSLDPSIAKKYAQSRGLSGYTIEKNLLPNAKIITLDKVPNSIRSSGEGTDFAGKAAIWARKQGYDVLDMTRGNEVEMRILNKNVLTTKSQLTDIWKKANK